MLRHMGNKELFELYDSDLVLRLHNVKNLSDTRKMLSHFAEYLNGYPPSPELAKGYLAQYASKAPRTLYRYAQMLRVFMKWYGEALDVKIKIPKSIPPYTEDNQIEKLFAAIENKNTHKGIIVRDSLLVALALKSGLRRAELSNLVARDIHSDFLVVRQGKGLKDRIVPLAPSIALRLQEFISGMEPLESVFKLKPPCISMKIKNFARKAGIDDLHCHTLRHKYAFDLLQKGADIRQIQELLGHTNLSTTQVYLAVTSQGLRQAVNKLEDGPVQAKKLSKRQAKEARQLEDELFFGKTKFVESAEVR